MAQTARLRHHIISLIAGAAKSRGIKRRRRGGISRRTAGKRRGGRAGRRTRGGRRRALMRSVCGREREPRRITGSWRASALRTTSASCAETSTRFIMNGRGTHHRRRVRRRTVDTFAKSEEPSRALFRAMNWAWRMKDGENRLSRLGGGSLNKPLSARRDRVLPSRRYLSAGVEQSEGRRRVRDVAPARASIAGCVVYRQKKRARR